MESGKVQIGDIGDVDGNVNIAGRDVVNNIKTIYQRALTIAEEAARAHRLEIKLLAQGVSELARNVSIQASQGTESDNPYKGLLAYGLHEAEIFYGRNKAKKDLLNHIRQGPLTVLHAESGAGKSSLLQAGIAPQLIAKEHLAIYLRSYPRDPVDIVKGVFLPDLNRAPDLRTTSLREFLRYVSAILGPRVHLYLLLDQFEQFFRLPKEERQSFLEALADCLNDPSLRVHWVLALRGEYLSQLAELETFGVAPFKNMYRLNRLKRTEAQEAMTEPARRHGIQFEPTLTNHILDTLTTNGEVMPTHLQLVCSALSDDLPDDKLLTLTYYTEHEGGTQGILRDYLKRQLEHLPAAEQAFAWKVLRALITADRQRAVRTHDEIIEELKAGGMTRDQIDTMLGRLVERRLLFTQPATIERFELAHDYLVQEIEIDPQEQARKAAQELLEQEVRAYQRHGTLLSAEQMRVLVPYASELHFTPEANELFQESRKTLQKEQRARARGRRLVFGGTIVSLLIIISMLALWGISNQQQNQRITAQKLYAQSLLNPDTIDVRKLLLWAENFKDIPEARFGLFANYSPVAQHIQTEDGGWVYSMDISPDRNLLVTGRQDGTVNLWDAATMNLLRTLNGPPNAIVHFVKVSPRGDLLAASFDDADAHVYLWRLSDQQLLASIPLGHEERWVKSIAFNSNETIMAMSLDGHDLLQIWDITFPTMPKQIGESILLSGRAASIAFSPDDELLAAGLIGPRENTIVILDATNWDMRCTLPGIDWIYSLEFNRTGDLLASGGRDKIIRLWDPHSCTLEGFLAGNEDSVESVSFSPDGTRLVSSGFDGTVRVWSAQEQREIGLPLRGHKAIVQDAVFGKDNNTVYSGSLDNSIIVWNLNQSDSIGKKILSGSGAGNESITYLSFDAETKRLVAFRKDGQIHLLNARSQQEIPLPVIEPGSPARRVVLSYHGKSLAIYDPGKLQILGIDTGTTLASFDVGQDFSAESLVFTPDGSQVILVGNQDRGKVYGVLDQSVRDFHGSASGPEGSLRVIAVSPDGKYFATGDTRGTITLRDMQTLEPVLTQTSAHRDWVTALAFRADGALLASASYDGTILLWDGKTLEPIGLPLEGEHKGGSTAAVTSLAFSADNQALISGGADKSLIWWSLENHMPIGRFRTWDSSPVTSLAVSQDGQTFVSGSEAGNVYLWTMDEEQLVSYACGVAERNFEVAEWNQFLPGKPYHVTCPQYPPGQ